MTGTTKQAGRPQPARAESFSSGTLSQQEKDFIFPLQQAVLKTFGTMSKFVEYSLAHPARPARTRLVNPARSTSKGNPVNFKDVIYSQISGGARNFPEWWVVEWVITVVMRKSPEEDRIAALNKLGWAWAELRGERPWGFTGAIPGEDALTDPADVEAEETKYAVLRKETVPNLRHEVARMKALHETPQGRHVNLVEEIADLKASLALMEEDKNAAELRRAEAEDLVAHVRQRNKELQEHNDELVRANVAVNHKFEHLQIKFEHLQTLWQQRRSGSPAPMSGTLETTAEQTAVFLAVPAHPSAEALDPGADSNNEIAQQRYKHNAWRTPEVEGVSHDSTIDTTMMEIGQILAFGVPGDTNIKATPHDEPGTSSANASA